MTVYISRDDSYALEHHGVKGMKWGVRKDKKESHSVDTRSGETLVLERNQGGALAKSLSRINKNIRKQQSNTYNYDLKVGGKKVGDLQMYRKSKDEMNIVWGSVKPKYRNRGYMSAATKAGEKIAKELGSTKMTAELVGNSPGGSIHKLAKSSGYKKVGENKTKEMMDTWGGLTYVEKRLK